MGIIIESSQLERLLIMLAYLSAHAEQLWDILATKLEAVKVGSKLTSSRPPLYRLDHKSTWILLIVYLSNATNNISNVVAYLN